MAWAIVFLFAGKLLERSLPAMAAGQSAFLAPGSLLSRVSLARADRF
jgi:hypothetical protein